MPLPAVDTHAILRAAAGDRDAWSSVLVAWLPVVLGWCHRLAGPELDAEDLTHDVCLKVHDRLDQLEDPQAFPAWVYRITRDVIRKQRERKQRWAFVLSRLPRRRTQAPAPRDVPLGERVLALLAELPEAQQEVLVLCHVEERTREEVALLLDIPVGTVKSRLRLATERFRGMATEAGLLTDDERATWGA